MILELLREYHMDLRSFAGSGAILPLYIAAVLAVVIAFGKKEKGALGVIPSVLGTIAVVAGYVYDALTSVKTKRSATVYASVLFAAALALLVVTSSGKYVFSDEVSAKAANEMHLPDGLKEAMDAALEDCDNPSVLAMPGWDVYLSAYSSRFDVAYDDLSNTELSKVHPDMKKVADAARSMDCAYVILSNDIWPDFAITEFGYELIFEDDTCSLYREVKTSR